MNSKCPDCGAEVSPEMTCQDRFNLCLALEFEQPAFGEVHHLTVVCYMLQHNRYSGQGWAEAVRLLAGFVEGRLMPSEVVRRAKSAPDHRDRTGSITQGEKKPHFRDVEWTRTIADIRLGNADTYCEDVRFWATSVLRDIRAQESVMMKGRIAVTRTG